MQGGLGIEIRSVTAVYDSNGILKTIFYTPGSTELWSSVRHFNSIVELNLTTLRSEMRGDVFCAVGDNHLSTCPANACEQLASQLAAHNLVGAQCCASIV